MLDTVRPSPLLRDPDFRLWYLARSVSVAGAAASAVVLPLLAYQHSASARLTAAVVGLQALPYLLFGLFAGTAADRLRRRRMMVGADLACALLVLTVPAADAFGTLASWHILAVAFGIGTGFCWFDAAAWGALARIVGRPRLPEANGVIWPTAVALEMAVPAAAGLLAAATHPAAVVVLNAVTYLVSAGMLARIRGDLNPTAGDNPAGGSAGTRRRVRTDIGEGLRYLWRQPVIRTLSLTGFGLSVAGGGAIGLIVVHADTVLAITVDSGQVGFIYAACAGGSLAGAALLPHLSRSAGPGAVSLAGYAVYAAGLVGIAATPRLVPALVVWAVWNFAATLAITNGITVRQQLTPDGLQGRVNTTGRMIAWGGTPFGALLGGAVAEAAGTRAAYLTLAVPVLIGFVTLYLSPVRHLRSTVAVAR